MMNEINQYGPKISHDVWPLIFTYLPDSRDTIVNLTLSCSLFRWVAQPILFRKLTFRPFRTYVQFQRHAKIHNALTPAELEWQFRRLEFLTTPRISHAVRYIHITPTESWLHHFPDQSDGNIATLLDAQLQSLPAFVNLREIMFSNLEFTMQQMRYLSRVEKFRRFVVVGCNVPSEIASDHLLTVDHLRITPSVSTTGVSYVWLSAIKLDKVATLYFSTSENTNSFLTAARASCMQSLRSLDIHLTYSSITHILSVLNVLPALEILNITNFFRGESPISDIHDLDYGFNKITLPCLHRYNGPLNILMHLQLPALNFLNIGGISETIPAEPNALLQALPFLQKDMLYRVKNLGFVVLFLTESLARDLLTYLPSESNVECLRFFICNPRPTAMQELPPTDSLEMTCKAMMEGELPRNITKVHIFFYILQSSRPPAVINTVGIKDTLTNKCSQLRCLWLQRANDVFFWCRNADGKESMSNSSNPEYASIFEEA